jgi:very-short-patch-repair endonuclease
VTRRELLAAGITRNEIEERLERGTLLTQHRGVYRVGHEAPSTAARYMAAVKACGDRAVLSHRAAAHLYSLIRGQPPPPEVTAPTERRVHGATTHRRHLHPRDITTFRDIPITTVPATLIDLAAELTADELARACHEAGVKYRTTPRQVQAAMERRRRAKGRRELWSVMTGAHPVTLSKLEKGFLALLRDNALPLPRTNRRVGNHRVDCRWETPQLTVELDGYRFHNSRYAWEQDRSREREARARGDDFRRYTYGDVFEDPRPMLRELRLILA